MADATDDLKALEAQGLAELPACTDEAALRAWYGKFLGEKGLWKAAFGKMGAIPKDQKAAFGAEGNRVKSALDRGLRRGARRGEGPGAAS